MNRFVKFLPFCFVFVMICCRDKSNLKKEVVEKRLWVHKKSIYDQGEVYENPKYSSTEEIFIGDQGESLKTQELDSRLSEWLIKKDSSFIKISDYHIDVLDFVGTEKKTILFNLLVQHNSQMLGIVYGMNTGVVMKYKSHGFDYLIAEIKIGFDGKLKIKYFNELKTSLRYLKDIPKHLDN